MEIILSPDVVLIRDFFLVRAKLTYFRLDHGGEVEEGPSEGEKSTAWEEEVCSTQIQEEEVW